VRLRLDLAYDGGDFSGWAAQPGRRTVQGTLDEALSCLLGAAVVTTCAGRTDAGVHARGQVCHVDTPAQVSTAQLRRRLAALLPPDVRVHRVSVARDGFDARFSALWRRYAYRVCDDAAALDPLRRAEVLVWRWPLDEARLNAASEPLLGEHDFAAFCRARERATTVRTLHELSWRRTGPGMLTARVVADAFCHTMVRSLMGALLPVGDGRRPVPWPGEVLAGRVRHPGVAVVPPHGLVLEEVGYPAPEEMAARAQQSRAVRVSSG
jgi:tRNA pseudouridine38-40 synthase